MVVNRSAVRALGFSGPTAAVDQIVFSTFSDPAGKVNEAFADLPRISIDYALMERTDRAFVVPGRFEWDDIGDWVALERLVKGDGTNTVVGRHVGRDASGNIVYTEDDGDVVVTLGVHDLVIVKRGHALLLVHKDRVQEIKDLLADERLKELLNEPVARG